MKHDDDKKPDIARLRALVESYGADSERWPAEDRRAFDDLAASDDGRAWLAEQRRLDAWLSSEPDVLPSAALLRRVAEIPVRHAPSRPWVWPFGRLRNVIAVAAAAAVTGIVVGIAAPDFGADDRGDEWDDLSTLALGADLSVEAP